MRKTYALIGLLVLSLGLLSCQTSSTGSGAVSEHVVVVQSPNDRRAYDYFELDNRLRVLVISDPEAKKAAVSLDVATGSKDDPQARQGLAHFLEHMLFLGTEKYPTAGEYQEFISTHGGQHNAYTSFENTNYFFDIDTPYLASALDRFSQFFVSPLFTAKYVEREKHAVESEYRAKYKSEGRRGLDVFREVINPEHPFARFSVGSLQTLADTPDSTVRDELLAFYRNNYSANRMTLVLLGNESTADLRSMVEQRFSAVPDHELESLDITEPLFDKGTLPAKLYVTPEQNMRVLDLVFPVADPRAYWQAKPIHMIADIIGHEGEGSLLQYLKQRGWAESLSAGAGLEYDGGAALNLSVKLTEAGYAARNEVVIAVFQLIDRMKKEGISRQRFDEQRKISEIQFRYQDKSENIHYVMGLATAMRLYPAAKVLEAPYEFSDYDPQLYREYLAQLRPDNVLLTVTGPGLPADRQSHWYQTPYSLEPVAPDQLETWREVAINPSIDLPAPNPFIPDQFERLESPYADSKPRQLDDGKDLRLWFGDDEEFTAPRASLRIGFFSPLANDSARHAVLLNLYAAMIADSLNPKLYPALLAGFSPRLSASRRGLHLGIDGFSDKQPRLLDAMLEELQHAPLDGRRFADIKRELMRNWQNSVRQPPYQYLPMALRSVMYTPYYNEDEKLAAAADLTVADLEQYRREFLERIRFDVLTYGNTSVAQAKSLRTTLGPLLRRVKGPVELPGVELAALQAGSRWHYPVSLDHSDAAIVYYVQGAGDDNHQRVLMGLTGQIIRTPYYHSLRTEQQFGYVVYAATTVLERTPGLSFIVQSPTADAATLVAASDKLMGEFLQTAETMERDEFEQHKTALRSMINRPHKNLAGEASFYWQQVLQEYFEFDRREQLTGALDALELEQWRGFYKDNFTPRPARAVIVTQSGDHDAESGAWRDTELIEDPAVFKRGQPQRRYP